MPYLVFLAPEQTQLVLVVRGQAETERKEEMMVHYAGDGDRAAACGVPLGPVAGPAEVVFYTGGVTRVTCPFCIDDLKNRGDRHLKQHGVLLSDTELENLLNDNEVKKTFLRDKAFSPNRKGIYCTLVWEQTKKSKTVFIGVGYIDDRWVQINEIV